MSNCVFVTFQSGILGQVWYLNVSIPKFSSISYFYLNTNFLTDAKLVLSNRVNSCKFGHQVNSDTHMQTV